MRIKWKVFVVSLVVSFAVGFAGSLFTSPNTGGSWYNSIKPAITPPNFVFPIVWNILFFLIALSLYFAWTNSKKKERPKLAWAYGINFLLNILWSVFFFQLKLPLLSFFEIILLWASIFLIILITRKISKTSAYLLVPYLIWVSFAGLLNFIIAF